MTFPNIPTQFSTIQVQFAMPDGKLKWWPGFVEHISPLPSSNTALALARILFESGKYNDTFVYKAESTSIQFLENFLIRSTSRSKTFPKGSEATWRFPVERNSSEHIQYKNASENNESEDCELDTNQEQQNASEIPETFEPCSVSQCDDMQLRFARKYRTRSNLTSLVNSHSTELENVNDTLNYMQTEISALRRKLQTITETSSTYETSMQVNEMKLYIHDKLIQALRRTRSRINSVSGGMFHSSIRRCPMELKVDCSWANFCSMVKDMSMSNCRGLHHFPNMVIFHGNNNSLRTAHLIFESFLQFTRWLGVDSDRDFLNTAIRRIEKNGVSYLQVIGGTQYDENDSSKPLNFIPFGTIRSSIPIQKTEPQLGVEEMESNLIFGHSLTLSATRWDNDNGRFLENFRISQVDTKIDELRENSYLQYDTYSITWSSLKRKQSLAGASNIYLGQLHIFIPSLIFIGGCLANEINQQINSNLAIFCPNLK